MPRNVEEQIHTMDVMRTATVALDVAAGFAGGVAVNALFTERKPVKAAVFGTIAAGLGWMAHNAGDGYQDEARRLGHIQSRQYHPDSY